MKNFNRDSRFGGSRGGKRQDFSDNRGSRPGMHQAICNECGKECEVPFRPTGDRPVYCSACFEKQGNMGSSRPQGKSYQRGGFDNKRMFNAICDKCGKECEVPFRPTEGKPVYCSQCFDKGSSAPSKSPDQFKQQFEIINSKLDKILKSLTNGSTQTSKEEKPEKEAKKIEAKKTSPKVAKKSAKAKKVSKKK